jgi:hypothetical protein
MLQYNAVVQTLESVTGAAAYGFSHLVAFLEWPLCECPQWVESGH